MGVESAAEALRGRARVAEATTFGDSASSCGVQRTIGALRFCGAAEFCMKFHTKLAHRRQI